jgi:UDP-GlcNAc:undecaprenyl-phosphate/decaprenyl-phosphate GlcNAc-1-phosphate transferase
MWPLTLTLCVALAGAAALTPLARGLSWRLGFLDQPAVRKVHVKATPLLGGAAVGGGMLVALVVGANVGLPLPGWGTLLGLLVALSLGLVDDRIGLGPGPKLAGQLLAGAFFVIEGQAAHLTGWWPADLFLTLFWVVALMNAINFLDNMDGIAAGIGAVAGFSFAVLALRSGDLAGAVLGLALTGGCCGFLVFNFSPASIFLGDTGSLLVGATLARLSLGMAHGKAPGPQGLVAPLVALLVLAYPVFDITFVTVVRLLEGRKIYQGGRDHSSHRLDGVFKDHRATALAVYALSLALSGLALAVHSTARFPLGLSVLAGVGVFFVGLGVGLARIGARTT